jgi:hypothetical protein
MGRHANRKKQIEEPADALSALANTVFALVTAVPNLRHVRFWLRVVFDDEMLHRHRCRNQA